MYLKKSLALFVAVCIVVLIYEILKVKELTPSPYENNSPKLHQIEVTSSSHSSNKQQKEFTIWSTSYRKFVFRCTHINEKDISPIECLRHFMENDFTRKTGRKVRIINKSLSGHCHIPKTCAKDLKVLNSNNAGSRYCSEKIGERFFDAYKQDDEFSKVDLVMCDHNIAMCELYMAFNKPMVLQATTRYELWRHQPTEWKDLNNNLERIASKPYNSIIANNLYDANYVHYFTGLNIPVLDSYCAYSADGGTYNPTRKEFLIGPSRSSVNGQFFETLNKLIAKDGNMIKIKGIRELYSHYRYTDLASHPAIIIIPYQVSVMSLFEYYRMNIPMYAPSITLLTKWHLEYRVLNERTWGLVYSGGKSGARGSPKEMDRHPNANLPDFDPNNDIDETSVLFWNQFSDFYQWPHIIIFNSWEDLFSKLKGNSVETYKEISKKMEKHNQELSDLLVKKWLGIIESAESKLDRNEKTSSKFEEAIKTHWNIDIKC